MKFLPHLFDNNRKWATEIKRRDPEYFERLSKIQKPEYLWIGTTLFDEAHAFSA